MLGHDRRSLRVGDKEKHEASIRRASYSATVHRTKCSRVLRRLLRVTVLPVSLDTFYLIFFLVCGGRGSGGIRVGRRFPAITTLRGDSHSAKLASKTIPSLPRRRI